MTKGFTIVRAIALGAALTLTAAAPIAFAQSGDAQGPAAHARGGGWGHGKGAFFFGGLDLTDAQKTQMQQIHEAHRQTVEPLAEQVRQKRQEIWKLNDGATFDEAATAAKLAEIAPLEAKLMAEQHQMRQEMLNVLTPEQRTQLEQRKEQWKQRRGEAFRGGRHGRQAISPSSQS